MLAALAAIALFPSSEYVVQPFYVYPADQPMHPEYVAAIKALVVEIQGWYRQKAGVTFRLAPLRVIEGEEYLVMRGGSNPSDELKQDIQKLPNWWDALQRIVRGPTPKTIDWVFAQGGGGFAGANLWGDYQGFATFGDWVLEPISGVREPKAIHSGYATWQVQGGTPKGTTAHELGHAFGLHHPDKYSGKSIMKWHGDYPDTGFMPHEVMALKENPFFNPKAFDKDAPWLDFENADTATEGQTLQLSGKGFRAGMKIEFRWIDPKDFDRGGSAPQKSERVEPEILSETSAKVTVPLGYGPGYVRAWMGKRKGNVVGVNGYPKP